MAKNDNGEYEYTEEGIIVHHPSDLHECIYKAITDGQTVLPPQINRFCYNGADADVKNESYFYNINYWSELLELVDTSSLKAIEPGKNRQIYLVFDAKEKIGVHIDAIAEEDEEYTIRNIGGMLHPIGPVRFVRKDTSVFTIVFTPKRIKDDYNSEKFVWTRVFPGYPYVNYLLDGLKELGIKPLIEIPGNKVPLFVPIYLDDRNTVRKRMFQREVFCPVHWPLEDLPLKKGAEMAQHELSLIVDQRYVKKDMDLIINIIKK